MFDPFYEQLPVLTSQNLSLPKHDLCLLVSNAALSPANEGLIFVCGDFRIFFVLHLRHTL